MLYFRREKLCPLGRTFFCIFGAKNYEGKRLLPLRQWGGGVSLFAYSLYIKHARLYPRLFPDSSGTHKVKQASNQVKKGQKRINFWCALVFSREFRRQQTAKCKHIFEMQEGKQAERWPAVCLSSCPLGGRWCAPAPSLWVCSAPLPFLCPFPASALLH